jgi:hypothetical protein
MRFGLVGESCSGYSVYAALRFCCLVFGFEGDVERAGIRTWVFANGSLGLGRVTALKEPRGNVREQAVTSILCLTDSSLIFFFLEVTTIDTSGSIVEQEMRTRSGGGWNENDGYNSRLSILFQVIAVSHPLPQTVLVVEFVHEHHFCC